METIELSPEWQTKLTGQIDFFIDFFGILLSVSVRWRGNVDEAIDCVTHVDVKIGRRFVAVERRSR